MTPCLLISSYPKFLRNLLLWTRKISGRFHQATQCRIPQFECACYSCVLRFWHRRTNICMLCLSHSQTYLQTNRITWQHTAVFSSLHSTHFVRSSYLSAVPSFQSQPFQGEHSGHMCLPCEAETDWCLLRYELPLPPAPSSTVPSSMPT